MDLGISRRSFLTTAGVVISGIAITGLAACSEAVPAIPEPSPSPTGPIRNQLDQALSVISAGNRNFGVFITDVRSGRSYSYSGDYASQSASMAKPMIVAMASVPHGTLALHARWPAPGSQDPGYHDTADSGSIASR